MKMETLWQWHEQQLEIDQEYASEHHALLAAVESCSFTQAYAIAAIWAAGERQDDEGEYLWTLDEIIETHDLTVDTLRAIVEDCRDFQESEQWKAAVVAEEEDGSVLVYGRCSIEEQGGHDFLLTRDGHGAGFWDGDWHPPHDDALTDVAKSYGTFNFPEMLDDYSKHPNKIG